MSDLKSLSGSIIIRIVILLAVIALLCVLLLANFGLVAEFAVDRFSDFRLSSDKWSGAPGSGYVLEGLRVESKTSDIAVMSKKATVKILSYSALLEKSLEVDIDLKGVEFSYGNSPSAADVNPENILEAAFASALEYREIAFKLSLDGDNIRVSDFEADSENIRVKGDFSLFKDTGRAVLEVEISFSPAMSEHFADFVKQGALTTGSDGWYSTVISYTGPTVLLKALYSITSG